MPPTPSLDIGHWSLIIPRRRRRGGFALLITITLLAFLVLLLVSLAALTRVETQVASNNQHLAQARQNALLALNIALGQLQKHAGPDQRITARADLQGGETVPSARWTGAYGSAVSPDYDQRPSDVATALATPANLVANGTGSPARLLSWLVSGNETDAFDPSTDIGARGHVTVSAANLLGGLEFSPTTAISGLTVTSAASSALSIADRGGTERPAVLLVGPGSVRSAVVGVTPIDYVAAPLVKIEVAANNLPGLTGSSLGTIGRYAWWVGDEGVKARINFPLATTSADKPAAFASSRRAAIELMDAANPAVPQPALTASRIGAAYNPDPVTNSLLGHLLAPRQFTLLGAPLADTAARRFHDLTALSAGVLADTYAGGLKRDLSSLLYVAPPGGDPTADTRPVHATDEAGAYTVPTWLHLRSHARNTVGADGLLTPRLPVFNDPSRPDDVGVYPVITYAALGFRYAAASAPAPGVAINFNLYPLVVLWNPYNSRMKGATYEVGYSLPGNNRRVQLQMEDTSLIPANPTPPELEAAWLVKESRDIKYAGLYIPTGFATDRTERFFRFLVQCPDMEAGESLILTLPANATYTDGAITPCPTPLARGLNQHAYASMSNSVFESGEETRRFRFVSDSRMKTHANTFPASGQQLASPASGGMTLYLGVPRTTAPNVTSDQERWDPNLNRRYQLIESPGHDSNTVDNPLQAPALLGPSSSDDPALKTFVIQNFSSTGNNRTANLSKVPLIRWIAQTNIRAPISFRSRRDLNFCTNYIGQVGTDSNMWPTWFIIDAPGDRASAGLTHDWDSTSNQPVNATLFEVPRAADPLFSIGQLQHANLSLSGTYPAYAVGNSLADYRLPNFSQISTSAGRFSSEPPDTHSAAARQRYYYDNSWLLNRALWDRYFFSTVPAAPLPALPANPRHIVRDTTKVLRDPDQAAAALLLDGAFNINSTSEQAWRAILGGVNQLVYDPVTPANPGTALGAALTRFSRPTGGSNVPSGTTPILGPDLADLWQGYRVLSEHQIAQLARNIVAEIRARGPFVSLADFVNRRLVDNPATSEDERIKGALQAAIDATVLTSAAPSAFASNDAAPGTYWSVATPIANLGPGPGNALYYSQPAARGGAVSRPTAAYQKFAAFAPKFLTQADVLSAVGASLSARSDTFLVRTYGEVINPVTNETTGRAWCEAVVQRTPDYVETADAAESPPTTPANIRFGRRFQIVSFRWLSPSDI
ncbi:MAG: hypothetical protein K0R17_1332 [Rariglobus sp.]|jgi:hypothetical protein|nr:hypothetical protein [Rariglobus sp.]